MGIIWTPPRPKARRLKSCLLAACLLALGPASRGQERLDLTAASEAERSPEERSLEDNRTALDLARRLGHVEAEAEAHYALAVRSRALGQADAAKTHGDAALELYERQNDPAGAAAAHDLLGALEAENGYLDAARAAFERALALRREAGDRAGEATSLHNLASCALDRGDAAGALESLGHALELHRRRGDEAAQAAAWSNLGLLRLQIGRFHRARRDLDEAVGLYRRLGDERGLAGAFNNLGLLEHAEKRYEDAAGHFRRALDTLRRLGSIDGPVIGTGPAADQAKIRGNLGLALTELGEWSNARRELEAALGLAHRHALHRVAASHRGSLGRLELRQAQRGEKRPDEAVALLARAAAELEALNAPRSRSATLLDLAEALRLRGETAKALARIEEAVDLLENLRRPLARDGSAIAHALAVERHAYDLRVDLLVELERPREALAASESARARGLLNLLRGIAGEQARSELDASRETFFEAVSAEKLDELLDADTLLLVYHLGERSARVFSLEPSADGSAELRVRSLGSSAEIEMQAARTHESLALSRRRAYRGPARQAAGELAGRLLPDAATLGRYGRLVVVPDGGLHRVPFAALVSALEATPPEIVRAPSLAVLAELRRRARPAAEQPETPSLAILADPIFDAGDERLAGRRTPPPAAPDGRRTFERLTWSGVEAESIAALFPPGAVDLRLGLDAGEDALLSGELSRHSRLHFATHALVDDVEPERSGLALSVYSRALDAGSSDSNRLEARRGFVELADLFELRLDAELVTLSACRSALGKSLRGEGLLGLSHGFFAAGARRLVLSLWDVDDRATSALMVHFYRALAAGERPAAALDSARRAMHQDPRWRAPFYWAGFVLIGDWR